MFLSFLKSHLLLKISLAITLATAWLHAAPYGPDGVATEWTQPDGTQLSLRVFGDEFYGRTETLDGYTVVFDPATKSYNYADVSEDGKVLVATAVKPGQGNPQALGLAKHLDIEPAVRKTKAATRFQEWDQVTETSQRWSELKTQRQAYEEALQEAKSEGGPMPAPPSFTTIGEKVGLTLLIDFSDAVGTIPQAEIINYCNSDNYTGYSNNGSIKKYFQDNSKNLLTYTNTVTAYIRMAQPKSYYNDTTQDSGTRGRLLINDAIDIMKALPNYNSEILPTFDTLTVDGSNRAVACNVFFAGGNSGVWSKGLWPHAWSLSSAKELSAGGKKVFKYQITNLGTSLTLGTFCHENGHMLCGYPDLYDYQGDSVGGAGKFCLMGSGGSGTNPVLINAYLKRASGWTTTTELTSSSNFPGTLVSTVGHADYNKIYRYANPAAPTTEYFLFENRQKTGRDASISASGIAIWHIDQLGSRDNQSLVNNTTHANYEVSLIQADNLWQFQSNSNSGDSKDLYYLGNTAAAYTNTFNDTSSPDAKWWSGASSGLNTYNFSSSGTTMTLQFGLPPNTLSMVYPNGGEPIYFGSTQEVRWLSNTSGNVKIELYKGGVPNTVLSASETNDGSYSWVVSSGLPAGNDYTIRISSVANPAYTDSSNATFSILTQPTLADALDTSGFTWTNSGNANWIAQSTTTHDGIDAAQSGVIADNQSSSMETTVTGPGTLTFWWKISSESGYDFIRFYLDGIEQTGSLARISGTVDWVQKTVSIPSGIHTLKWSYTKDVDTVAGSDAAWVDQVVYTPSSTPEIAVEQPIDTNLVDGVASIDCGFANLVTPSPPLTFTVKNLGDGDLTGLSLSKDGTHSDEFTLGSLGATTLAPGASTTFTVTFLPTDAGPRTAAIHIASNDANENPFDIALTGTGVTVGTLAVTPAVSLTASGTLGGLFSPSSLQYTLSNPGSTSIDWTADKTADWVDLTATSGTLAPGANTTVTVSINGNADSLPINNFSDTVTLTNTTNGNGDTTRGVSLTVNPLSATVTLGNLSATYDGSPKSVSVTTNPPGLAHTVTYGGSATAPTNAGTYAVVATITDPDYAGSDSKDLVIAKASQSVTFAALDLMTDIDEPFDLEATATSGLPASFTSSSNAVATVDGDTVTIVGLGTTTITASQAGNANFAAAASVPQPLTVVRANPLAIITGDPFKVLIGQSLSLVGSASEPSHEQTITTYEWDLNNDDIVGDATGATPSAISVAELISTWGMTQGLNEIQLKVTDSANKTSIVTATVEVILSLTWDANGTSANRTDGAGAWTTANQWWDGSTNVTWASGSSATFGNTGAGGAVTLGSPTTMNAITFNVFTGTYTLGTSGQMLTLNGGISKNTGSGTVAILSPVTLGAAQTWTHAVGSLTTGSGTNLIDNAGYQLTVDGVGNTTFGVINNVAAALTGSGALVKSGSGTLSLGGTNAAFTGNVTVNGGILRVNAPGSINGNLNLSGGVYEHYWNDPYTRTLGTGPGQVQITGGTSGFSENGATGATFTLNNSAAFELVWGSALFNPTTFVLQADTAQTTSALTLANKIDLNGTTRTIHVSGGTTGAARATISGVIRNSTGTAGIIKTGNGQLILSANNTYNGTTTVSAGFVDFGAITLSGFGGGSGRNISVAAGTTIRRNALDNVFLNRLVETNDTITVMTGGTANNLDFSSSTGANLPNAFLGNWASNGAKAEYSGILTPASDAYRLGGRGSSGFLGMVGTNRLTGPQGLIVGGTGGTGIRVMLAGANDFTGDTVINSGARLTLGHNLAMQNSALDVGSAGGNFALNSAGTITGAVVASSPTFGGLKGGRNLLAVFTNAGGNNEANLAATAVTGFTLNPGAGRSHAYSGAIANFAAGTTLTKTGLGTQTLAGTNTYTGATNINQGSMFITGSLSNTDVELMVNSGATLGGTGTIGRNVTIASGGKLEFDISTNSAGHDRLDISAGRNFTFSGASELTINSSSGASPGTYTLITGGNNITGVAPATLNLPPDWVATVSISANSLLLNLTSTVGDNIPPTLASITDDTTGSPILVNTPVNYTVTFSEDMNSTTATAADFGNAGTSEVTIGTVTESTPGVFTVQATPTTAGTLQFRINAGAVITDIAGNELVTTSALADDTLITVNAPPPYDTWSGGAAFDADSNGDGVDNGMAWVLGAAAPSENATHRLPTANRDGNNLRLTFRCLKSTKRGGAVLKVQSSNDLGQTDSWTSHEAYVPDATGPVNGVEFTVTPDGEDFINVVADIPAPDAKLFTRLILTTAP